jgi:hypothetical protein
MAAGADLGADTDTDREYCGRRRRYQADPA